LVFAIITALAASLAIVLFNVFDAKQEQITISTGITQSEFTTLTTEFSTNTQASEAEIIFPIDLNSAEKSELMQLDGIGEKTAEKILAYRYSGNYYYKIEDLMQIEGIGKKTFSTIKDKVCVNAANLPKKVIPATEITTKIKEPPPVTTKAKKAQEPPKTTALPVDITAAATSQSAATAAAETEPPVIFPIDINSAGIRELTALDGIGESIAAKIISYREKNYGFYSTEEIMEVSGIGRAKFEAISSKIFADTSRLPPKPLETEPTTVEVTVAEKPSVYSVNLNSATFDDLIQLPKITENLANAILNFRENVAGKIKDTHEILYVNGISDGIYNAIKDYIYV
ncbi:MAG: helix-hairpin-helix domain-containing protein, partial [Oscillospiraceae bacterium]